jgi:hypothetical protein
MSCDISKKCELPLAPSCAAILSEIRFVGHRVTAERQPNFFRGEGNLSGTRLHRSLGCSRRRHPLIQVIGLPINVRLDQINSCVFQHLSPNMRVVSIIIRQLLKYLTHNTFLPHNSTSSHSSHFQA